MADRERVLLVEDVPELATLYELWLEPVYDVSIAPSGELALDQVDHETDIVLLNRRLPNCSGDSVLQTIRARGLDCTVVLVSALAPDLEIIDLPFDDYLHKPFTATELRDTLRRLQRRRRYDDTLQRWFTLVSKRATLQSTMNADTLSSAPEYHDLLEQIDAQRPDRQTVRASLDAAAARSLFTEKSGT